MAGQLTTPRELLAACLRQMLWIERQLAYDVLPRLREQALHRIYGPASAGIFSRPSPMSGRCATSSAISSSAEPEESPGFRGLVAEHEQLVGRVAEDDHLLSDLAHGVAALATEHLELATYESLVSLAESLGEEEVAIRLARCWSRKSSRSSRWSARWRSSSPRRSKARGSRSRGLSSRRVRKRIGSPPGFAPSTTGVPP